MILSLRIIYAWQSIEQSYLLQIEYKQTVIGHGARSFTRPSIYQNDLLPDHNAILHLG